MLVSYSDILETPPMTKRPYRLEVPHEPHPFLLQYGLNPDHLEWFDPFTQRRLASGLQAGLAELQKLPKEIRDPAMVEIHERILEITQELSRWGMTIRRTDLERELDRPTRHPQAQEVYDLIVVHLFFCDLS